MTDGRVANSWGTVPFGTSRLQVRHIVLWLGIALWLIPTLVVTGIQGIAWFAFNLAFVLILTIVATPVRSVSIQRLAICFFAGGLTMGLTVMACLPLMNALGSTPLRPFITVPIEELFKLLPLFFLLWRGRKFSSFSIGITDILLMGAISGAGFAFVEDAYAHAANHAMNNLSVWLPSSELVNGRIVSGHAVWTGLAAATIGLGWMFRHVGKVFLLIAVSGVLISTTDHLALNYNQTQGAVAWGAAFFNFVSASGWLPLVLFLGLLALSMAIDSYIQLRTLPAAPEFKLPARKDRKDSLESLWDSVLDLRRLAYAYFRYKHAPEPSASLSLTVALLAKRLINRAIESSDAGSQLQADYGVGSPATGGAVGVGGAGSSGISMDPGGSPFAIRGPGEAPMMPRAGQAAPPDFNRLNGGKAPGAQMGQAAESFNGATQITGMGGASASKPTGERPFIMPYDKRPLIEIIDLPEQYEVFEQVSEGGMGVIFRGRHKRTGARLAIKVMHPHLANNQNHLARFEQEARTASTLDHPNIVVVHDFGITQNSIAYLVMEWLDGSNLEPVIKIGGTLSLSRFLHIFLQATSALAHAHRKGVIHRDIKPSNLILATTPERPDFVKIVDFGIAKVLTEETESVNLTRTGDILGSPLFMSPEQCMGNKMDARSDIYSLGCVMYEALVGQTPLKGENAVQLIFRHVHDMPAQPRSIKPDIEMPDVMEPLLFKCLQKDPDKRFSSMDELEAELKRVQAMLNGIA